MHIFRKASSMFKNLRRRIFGVGPSDLEAGRMASQRQADSESPLYLPASRLTEAQIHGVGDSGDCWAAWRVDGDGEKWFQRISHDAVEQPPAIVGIAANDDDGADDIEAFDSDEPDHECDSTDEIMSRFRREAALIKARHARGEMPDADDGEIGDADTDEFGDFSDDE